MTDMRTTETPATYPAYPSAPQPNAPDRRYLWGHRFGQLGVIAALAAATAYVLMFNPTDMTPDLTGPCAFHVLFGINGPMCGGTRMYWYMIHGNLVEAFRHHPVALLGVPFALYGFLRWTLLAWGGRRLPLPRSLGRIVVVYLAVWILFALVLRNLPAGPFTWFNIPNLG